MAQDLNETLDERTVRWEVHIGHGSNAYDQHYEFPRLSRALRHYDSIIVASGGKKRLLKVNKDGSRVVINRILT